MNIKDYTLKIGYRIGGKCKEESVEYALVKNGGYDGEDIRICDFGDADHVKIVVSAKSKIELTLAELIYDRYFENNERFLRTVSNPGRLRESIKNATCNTVCARCPNCR